MNADGFVINPSGVIKHLLTITNPLAKKPILQLFWWRKEYLLKAVGIILEQYSDFFSWIELNTWCPSNTVMKSWGWSDMLKHRPETMDIIKALSEAIHSHSDFSFSVKSRAGLNEEDKSTQLEFLREVANYTDFISVHWRTLKQLYSWDADFSFIKHLKELVKIPVIANGWVQSYDHAKEVESMWFDWVMIGQSAIGNPWIFTPYVPSAEERLFTMLEHLKMMIAAELYFQENAKTLKGYKIQQLDISLLDNYKERIDKNTSYHTLVEFRKYAFCYVKWLNHAREWKIKLQSVKTYREFEESVKSLLS